MEVYSSTRVLSMLRALHRMGFTGLRFFSFLRWTGTLGLVFYQEFPFKSRNGEALYVKRAVFEIKPDLTFVDPCTRTHEWARSDLALKDSALLFAAQHLGEGQRSRGAFDSEYAEWLDSAIEVCPPCKLPVTGMPSDRADSDHDCLEWYPSTKLIPPPPGFDGAIDPYSLYKSELGERKRHEDDRRVKSAFERLRTIERGFE